MPNLDDEETELLRSYEADEWRSVPGVVQMRERFQGYATAMVESSVQLNVDLPLKDAHTLRAKALEEGMAPEALVAMVVHKYVAGRLVEKV